LAGSAFSPALANERVRCNATGQVVLKLKTPRRDGTTHLVKSPLEFMQRLAALAPLSVLRLRFRASQCRRKARLPRRHSIEGNFV